MKFTIDHDLHIHSLLSSCSSDPEQTTDRIFEYARANKLSRVCVTDHFWDELIPGASNWYAPQNFEHLKKSLPLPTADGIDFLFGCECDMDAGFNIGISKERVKDFDFIIVPTTHMHMKGFTISEEDGKSCSKIAELWVERFDKLLSSSLPFKKMGVAHLTCRLINNKSRGAFLETLSLIPRVEMERLFSKASQLGLGIEINYSDMCFNDSEADAVLLPYRIAKHHGCKFYLGSDAHHPDVFETAGAVFERAITLLGLTESDKFIPEA